MRGFSKFLCGIIIGSLFFEGVFAASMSSSSKSSSMGSSVRTSTPVRVSTPSTTPIYRTSPTPSTHYYNSSNNSNPNSDYSTESTPAIEETPYNPCDSAIDYEREDKEIRIKDFSFTVNYKKREIKYPNSNFHKLLDKSKIKYLQVSSDDEVGTYTKKDEDGCKVTVSKIASYVYGKDSVNGSDFLDLQLLYDEFEESISITLKDGSDMNVSNAFIILEDGTAFNLDVIPQPTPNFISKTILDYENYNKSINSFNLNFTNPKTKENQSFNSGSGDLILTDVQVKGNEGDSNQAREEFFNPETNKKDIYQTWYATFTASGNVAKEILKSINEPLSKGLTISPNEILLLDKDVQSFKINGKDGNIFEKSFYVKKKDSDYIYKISIGKSGPNKEDSKNSIYYIILGVVLIGGLLIVFIVNKNKIQPKDDIYI